LPNQDAGQLGDCDCTQTQAGPLAVALPGGHGAGRAGLARRALQVALGGARCGREKARRAGRRAHGAVAVLNTVTAGLAEFTGGALLTLAAKRVKAVEASSIVVRARLARVAGKTEGILGRAVAAIGGVSEAILTLGTG
jgi:hypothetical protein